jgi:hypothetical protein
MRFVNGDDQVNGAATRMHPLGTVLNGINECFGSYESCKRESTGHRDKRAYNGIPGRSFGLISTLMSPPSVPVFAETASVAASLEG